MMRANWSNHLKRHLSEKQQAQVAKQQDKKRDSANTGEVVAHLGRKVIVLADGITQPMDKRQHVGALVTGDKVEFEQTDHGAVVTARLERTNELVRLTFKGPKALVANVDLMCVVLAVEPAPTLTTIERYYIVSKHSNIPLCIAFNKSDLGLGEFEQIAKLYENIGIDWFNISVKNNDFAALEKYLQGKKTVMVGQSGVGKSSLIEALTGESLRTGALTGKGGHGAHTTSHTEYYFLDDGVLIDSPGARTINSIEAVKDLTHYFPEFDPYIGKCGFRDCTHEHEPNCAIIEAIEDGAIHEHRHQVYVQLKKELLEN